MPLDKSVLGSVVFEYFLVHVFYQSNNKNLQRSPVRGTACVLS